VISSNSSVSVHLVFKLLISNSYSPNKSSLPLIMASCCSIYFNYFLRDTNELSNFLTVFSNMCFYSSFSLLIVVIYLSLSFSICLVNSRSLKDSPDLTSLILIFSSNLLCFSIVTISNLLLTIFVSLQDPVSFKCVLDAVIGVLGLTALKDSLVACFGSWSLDS